MTDRQNPHTACWASGADWAELICWPGGTDTKQNNSLPFRRVTLTGQSNSPPVLLAAPTGRPPRWAGRHWRASCAVWGSRRRGRPAPTDRRAPPSRESTPAAAGPSLQRTTPVSRTARTARPTRRTTPNRGAACDTDSAASQPGGRYCQWGTAVTCSGKGDYRFENIVRCDIMDGRVFRVTHAFCNESIVNGPKSRLLKKMCYSSAFYRLIRNGITNLWLISNSWQWGRK